MPRSLPPIRPAPCARTPSCRCTSAGPTRSSRAIAVVRSRFRRSDVRIDRVSDDRDLDAIVALETESFTNPWTRETLEWELRNSDVTHIYVLRLEDGIVAAFCVCWIIFDELHINTVAVAPAERRRGRATALLKHVMAEAAARHAVRATLEVRASNIAALKLYEGLGFRVTATRPRYYSQPEEDALILWRDGLDL
ncbi:MAG: ribosomal-protein-alanine N-acetyltransferase [Acidobacteria bacterium]|nr:MAG: ribosomal-protein-alanine N-acetyltransferase [Acidobacteriota bacterium]